jgi:hypothetical protein
MPVEKTRDRRTLICTQSCIVLVLSLLELTRRVQQKNKRQSLPQLLPGPTSLVKWTTAIKNAATRSLSFLLLQVSNF